MQKRAFRLFQVEWPWQIVKSAFDTRPFLSCIGWTASNSAGFLAENDIFAVIAACEPAACGTSTSLVLVTACTVALDEFNNSPDVLGPDPTPAPFDRPGIDDSGQVSGADSSSFTGAQKSKLIIGRKLGANDCR